MDKKIKIEIAVGIILVVVIAVGIFVWKESKRTKTGNAPAVDNPTRFCTQEAKLCPDGSYVSRTGPNCEFAACPETNNDCAKEGESIGAVYPGVVPKKCCAGLMSVIPQGIVGTQGICQKIGIADKLMISSPEPDEKISSPVTVSGKAVGGWFFEASFPVEVYDSNNKLLGSSPVQFVPKSDSDTWMTSDFVDFKGEIKFSQPTTESGYILFKKDNPSGNSAMDESFKLRITFK